MSWKTTHLWGNPLAQNDHHRDGPSSDFRPTPKLENFISMVGTLVSYNTSPQRKVHPRIRWNDRLKLVHLTCSGWFGSSSSASISSSISWFGCHNITPALIPWNKVNWGSVRIGNMLHGSTWQIPVRNSTCNPNSTISSISKCDISSETTPTGRWWKIDQASGALPPRPSGLTLVLAQPAVKFAMEKSQFLDTLHLHLHRT